MASNAVNIVIIGTLDTKLAEFLYLRSEILAVNPTINVVLIDVGRSEIRHDAITILQSEIHKPSDDEKDDKFASLPRGEGIKIMIKRGTRAVKALSQKMQIHGIVSLGGSGGTSIGSAVMREMPLNLPKLMVSTVASGDISSYIAETDITMMYSVVDIAGLNEVLKSVISNAAAAIAGMAQRYASRQLTEIRETKKGGIGITMFGVTTPAVTVARSWLESQGFDVYIFHATGAGGRAMERLIRERRFVGVLDLTTTELADELAGGVFSAGEDRLKAAARAGLPQIVSVGALDMITFGPRDTVPKHFQHRHVLEHNPSVTLVRTIPEECIELGTRLASRLRDNSVNPSLTEVWLPLRGLSAMSIEGQPYYDREADDALFSAIKDELARTGSGIRVNEVDAHINDPVWAESLARRLVELIESNSPEGISTSTPTTPPPTKAKPSVGGFVTPNPKDTSVGGKNGRPLKISFIQRFRKAIKPKKELGNEE